jgi:hypothetical protein
MAATGCAGSGRSAGVPPEPARNARRRVRVRHKGALALEYRLGDSTLTSRGSRNVESQPASAAPHQRTTLPLRCVSCSATYGRRNFSTPRQCRLRSQDCRIEKTHPPATQTHLRSRQTLRAPFDHQHGCHTLETRQHARKDAEPAHPLAAILRERHGQPNSLFELASVEARGVPG